MMLPVNDEVEPGAPLAVARWVQVKNESMQRVFQQRPEQNPE